MNDKQEKDTIVAVGIPSEAIESLKRYTLDSLMLEGEVPRDIKHAITKAIADHISLSEQWGEIAEAIAKDVESRRDEIVKAISDKIVAQISHGVSHAAARTVQELGTALKSVRL